ncbi:MAG TPA: cytochrome c biogenesis protein ResB, partial [Bacillales bacterium]|nr:cytochrome c biogenesis protein ResB [Bacillales bacterium]
IAMIGVSLVICSLDRAVPLYKALKAQRVTRHEGFLKRQRIFGITNSKNVDESFVKAKEHLLARRYEVREENGDILAEKGRFSRWGPYVNHIGLIVFLIGGMLRFVPGMYVDKVLWIREGETKVVPGTNEELYLTNNQFILQLYDKNKDKAYGEALNRVGKVVKNYQSNVTLYEKSGKTIIGEKPELKKIKQFSIRVNQPLRHNGYSLYQVDYRLNELNAMTFSLTNKNTKQEFGQLKINLYDPKSKYDLGNGYSVKLLSYFPDFEFSKSGEPTTKSKIPNNPAFVFRMYTPDKPKGETSFVAMGQNIEPLGNNDYAMKMKDIETKNVSGLTVRKDMTLWVLIFGGFLFMFGVIQGAYWNHRRIWIQRKDGQVWISAHTNKNWHGLKREMEAMLEGTELSMPEDQLQEERA